MQEERELRQQQETRNHALEVEMQTLQLQVCLSLLLLQGVAVLQCCSVSVMSRNYALEVEMQTLQLQVCLCVLQCDAWRMIAQHSVLQCGAVCCSVLQCVAVCCSVDTYCSMTRCVAVWCGVLQCVAV